MPDTPYASERDVAVRAVREAAALCRAVQAQISTAAIEKKDRSPVTVADYGAQALVCRILQDAFPDDPVVGEEDSAALRGPDHAGILEAVVQHVRAVRPEEAPDVDADAVCRWIDRGGASSYSRRFWTLDPIDGTKGFLRGEQYAVALALVVDGEVQVAALACPNLPFGSGDGTDDDERGAVFTAVRGQGAEVRTLDGQSNAPISVSDEDDVRKARFCESVESGHSSHGDAAAVAERLGMSADSVRLDSQAKYAVVARGDAEIYLRLPTRPGYVERIWDHAAGVLVVEEAGGRATDVAGRPLSFRHGRGLEENRGVVVTNGRFHDEVLAALAHVGVA